MLTLDDITPQVGNDSQQLTSSASRGQSGNPSQIMLVLMQTPLPGHSHRARSVQPAAYAQRHVSAAVSTFVSQTFDGGRTAVVFIAAVVAVGKAVATLAGQDAAAGATLEVAGGALC